MSKQGERREVHYSYHPYADAQYHRSQSETAPSNGTQADLSNLSMIAHGVALQSENLLGPLELKTRSIPRIPSNKPVPLSLPHLPPRNLRVCLMQLQELTVLLNFSPSPLRFPAYSPN